MHKMIMGTVYDIYDVGVSMYVLVSFEYGGREWRIMKPFPASTVVDVGDTVEALHLDYPTRSQFKLR